MTHAVAAHTHPVDPPPTVDLWTEERVAILVQGRIDGVKRGELADAINKLTGSKFTRSAICGKIDRLFPVANPVKTPEERAETLRNCRERSRIAKKIKRDANREARGRAPKPEPKPVVPELVVVVVKPEDFPEARVVGIEALEPHHCRFICNDDLSQPVYCGLPIVAKSKFSWCAGHHHTLTQKPLKTWGAAA